MKKRLITILIMLTACGDGLNEAPSHGENIVPTVHAWCEKMYECGLTEGIDSCIDYSIGSLCADLDCDAPATEIQIDAVDLCLRAIDAEECSPFFTPGVCYTTWGGAF